MRSFLDYIDRYWVGILLGMLLPALFGWSYMERFHLWGALGALRYSAGSMVGKMFIVSSFPDMALMFLFYELDVWRLSKGVMIGCFPYVLAALFFCV